MLGALEDLLVAVKEDRALRKKLLDILSGSRQQRAVEIETLIYESGKLKKNGLDAALRLLVRDDLARAAEAYLKQ